MLVLACKRRTSLHPLMFVHSRIFETPCCCTSRLQFSQIKESDSDVEVPQSFFTSKELETLMEETKPEWVPASEYFTPEEGSAGKIGRGGLFVEEPVTGTRLRRLNNGVCSCGVVVFRVQEDSHVRMVYLCCSILCVEIWTGFRKDLVCM